MINAEYQFERQFVWTAIPSGRVIQHDSGQMALVSLMLTPRLLGQGTALTISNFDMQRWPERLATVRFDAEIQSQESGTVHSLQAQRVSYVNSEGKHISFSLNEQISAWETLFHPDTLVRSFCQSSYKQRNVRTFPTTEAAKAAQDVYHGAALTHLEFGCDAPHQNSALCASLQNLRETCKASLQRTEEGVCKLNLDTSPLARAYDFYRREHHSDFTMPMMDPNLSIPKPEFHDIVAKLTDHPLLLRILGLVIDLALPITELPAGNLLRIIPHWPEPATNLSWQGWTSANQHDICPRTHYELNKSFFLPYSTGRIHHGMLAIAGAGPAAYSKNPNWEIVPFDVDGAVLQLVGSLTNPSGDGGLPALRSMGFALVQHDREQMHNERVERSKQHTDAQKLHDAVLDAEDLLGGYRLDVLDSDSGRWWSLCERRVHYTIGEVSIGQNPLSSQISGLLEEGYVRPLSASTGAGANDALYIHETVACWDGWSTAVHRPDRVTETGEMHHGESPKPPFEFTAEPEPGSLPRLQFGRKYRMRVRVADLTGGGLYLEEVDNNEERTEVFMHYRFEPIQPPELVPTHKFQDGEAHQRLLIRSDRNVSADDYATSHGYRPYDLRYILAPKSSLELAMQHRYTFDSAIGAEAPSGEINRLFEVAKRADRNLSDIEGAYQVNQGEGSNSVCYTVIPEQGVKLPWLADPMSKAIALHKLSRPLNQTTGLQGQTIGLPKKWSWKGDWHSRLPIALRLVPANAGCTVMESEDQKNILVALGQAEEVTLEISSCPISENVDLFGIASWLGTSNHDDIVWGKHRMITPKQTITLVHAVQRPLKDPSGLLIPKRELGETICILGTDSLQIDTASTARLDIHASWDDYEDTTSDEQCNICNHTVQVGSYDVDYGPLKLPEIRQEFGDTRRRRVTYTVTAVSRFEKFFERLTAIDPKACLAQGELLVSDVPSSVRPPVIKLLYTIPTFRWEQSFDGDSLIRQRHGGGLRVFLERPWFSSGEDEALGVLAWKSDWAVPQDLSYISIAGCDPIWNTSAPNLILTSDYINVSESTDEYLQEGESNRRQPVFVYKVQFDKEGKRWYADIDLSKVADSSYFPFVRLALVRYQANSVREIDRLSAPIRTEPIQLPPTRRLIVTRTPENVTIVLEGLSPTNPKPNLVRAEVQILEMGYEDEAQDKIQTGVDEAQIEPENAIAGWTTVYSISGALSQSLSLDIPESGERPIRLIVQEYETQHPQLNSYGSPIEGSRRLIYADVVPLNNINGPYNEYCNKK